MTIEHASQAENQGPLYVAQRNDGIDARRQLRGTFHRFAGNKFGYSRRRDGRSERRGSRDAAEGSLPPTKILKVGFGDDAVPQPPVARGHDEENLILVSDAEILQQDRIDH